VLKPKLKTKGGKMILSNNWLEIFCEIDDFCMEFEGEWNRTLVASGDKKRIRSSSLCLSEVMTIVVMFHQSGYRTFKEYYIKHIRLHLCREFPKLVSYNRFVELMKGAVVPLLVYLQTRRFGKVTGISFIDSTLLRVCDNHRIHNHKVFAGIAKRGKCSLGWFFGFKLHLIVNDQGELVSFALTPGNVDDRDRQVIASLTQKVFGKLFGDKGYLSQDRFIELYQRGIQLITKLKKNMKNKLMFWTDKVLLRKRALIESINDELKNMCQIEHSRHRSPINFVVNLLSGLIAYSFFPKKPSLNFHRELLSPVLA